MQLFTILILPVFLNYGTGLLFSSLYKNKDKHLRAPASADVGDPLILTPFLQNGSILEAQQAALVQNSQLYNITSYAGYFTVDEKFDSNMWFWFFPSAGNVTEDPVLLWLTGGPGGSSLMGLFDENGPFFVSEDLSVNLREYSWHKNHSVIYLDNPVGAGFSFTTKEGYAQNETKVGDNLYSAMTQFFQLFPDLQKNPFYISGESYAGKYLPALGHAILKYTPTAELKINLQGILIGDGWTDPVHQLNYGPFLYNLGLVSAAQMRQLNARRDAAIVLINSGKWLSAFEQSLTIDHMIDTFTNVNIYNYIEEYDMRDIWSNLINTEEFRKALHVGNIAFGDKGSSPALEEDELQSVAPWVEEVLEHFRTLVYTGQLDITCGYPMVLDYLQTLNFTGVEVYHNSSRDIWYVGDDEEPAGYVKSGGNLVELLVRNAGHMVPRDQPKWAYDMLYKFTRDIPFV